MGLLACLLPMLAGCITYEETIHFNADGSGTVSAQLVVPRAALADSFASKLFHPQEMLAELSRPDLEEKLNKDGITIRQIAIEENDTARVWRVEYAFSDLEAFRRVRNEGRDVSLLQYDAGTYELSLVFSSGDDRRSEPAPESMDMTEGEENAELVVSDSVLLEKLLQGFSATFVIEVPTAVISAPRGRISGTTATFEWSYRREGMAVLQPKTMRVIFRKGALRWPTFEALPRGSNGIPDQTDVWDPGN